MALFFMVQEYSIKKIKQKLNESSDEILEIIIRGSIVKINDHIIYNNQQYFNFNLTDGTDQLVVGILQTQESQEKIDFIIKKHKSKKNIVIKEPRRPYFTLNKKKIDLIISSQNPPIGTEIIEDSHYKEDLNTDPTNSHGDNIKNTKNYRLKSSNETNSLKSAFTLLQQELENKPEDQIVKKFHSIDEFIGFLLQNIQELRNIEFFDISGLEKIPTNINFIINVKKEKYTSFESKFDFFIDKDEKTDSLSLLTFNIYNESIYRTIKDNLSFFITKDYYSQIKEILGHNK